MYARVIGILYIILLGLFCELHSIGFANTIRAISLTGGVLLLFYPITTIIIWITIWIVT